MSPSPSEKPEPRTVRINGVVAQHERLGAILWAEAENPDVASRCAVEIRRSADVLRKIAEDESLRVRMPKRSRDAFSWFIYLAHPERFERYVGALRTARRAAAAESPEALSALTFLLGHTGDIWRMQRRADRIFARASLAFMHAPVEVWHALMGTLLSRSGPKRKATIAQFIESDVVRDFVAEISILAPDDSFAVEGRVHDLDRAFRRVNERYFAGQMPRPRIEWSRRPSKSTFGTYQSSRDLVTVSSVLDDFAVPEFVVDFIIYHELLHKHHGSVHENGKRCVHTPSFRADERRFERFVESEAFLKRLAH